MPLVPLTRPRRAARGPRPRPGRVRHRGGAAAAQRRAARGPRPGPSSPPAPQLEDLDQAGARRWLQPTTRQPTIVIATHQVHRRSSPRSVHSSSAAPRPPSISSAAS